MPISASSDFSGEKPRSTGSNSGQFGKLVLLDDLAGEIARLHELHLAGDGFGIERAAVLVPLAVGRRKTFSRPSIRMRASDL